MPELVNITVDGRGLEVVAGTSLAAALLNAGHPCMRRSVLGEARSALCGMGICFECRVRVDGRDHVRACMLSCRPGLEVETGRG